MRQKHAKQTAVLRMKNKNCLQVAGGRNEDPVQSAYATYKCVYAVHLHCWACTSTPRCILLINENHNIFFNMSPLCNLPSRPHSLSLSLSLSLFNTHKCVSTRNPVTVLFCPITVTLAHKTHRHSTHVQNCLDLPNGRHSRKHGARLHKRGWFA